MKIAIIGYSGSGKSTLASYLSKTYNIPALYLDTVHFLPGWVEKDDERAREEVKKFMDQNDGWVIDGNYRAYEQERKLEEADQIIFMDFGRFDCLYRAIKRYKENKNTSRESMTQGCEEKLDKEFILWILKDGRDKKHKKRYDDIVQKYKDKTVILHNQKELDQFKKNLSEER